ncbi:MULTISPECIES: segregation and condensation protein A [Candidatus Ichthyocystis]|uniref:segregation and condensation protein A n=1 Tax=Candidatus Ichthyocystis TaxID=2929841 RepID=UPI000AF00C18|nr:MULTISPECIES: ScpA family protein [Ichthyocystis]
MGEYFGKEALVYGEKLPIPDALYIPPEALEVCLEAFSGPMDLLWYLIKQTKINIIDIPMALLTEQYLCYVDRIRQCDLRLAADYLLMAALLIDIKLRSLLPSKCVEDVENSDAEGSDPRDDLVKRLIEYEKISGASRYLTDMTLVGRDCQAVFVEQSGPVGTVLPKADLSFLVYSWKRLLQLRLFSKPHSVAREVLVVSEFVDILRNNLKISRFFVFQELCNYNMAICYKVVYFLAILELVKLREAEVAQDEPLSYLYVRRREASDAAK